MLWTLVIGRKEITTIENDKNYKIDEISVDFWLHIDLDSYKPAKTFNCNENIITTIELGI